ncbi:MAG: MerR family transcriptional regulator [Dehalococcoidales bacterium]|nr:MerR family transcriptional regulator [Dehalococcoidales bacterium]
MTNQIRRYIIQAELHEILSERIHEMLRITELARKTGASVDEIHYLERKGFTESTMSRLTRREVRKFQDTEERKIQLIINYRRQGFTWDVAFQKASQEFDKPTLFDDG